MLSKGDDPALWNALLARSLQHSLQQVHDVRVVYPLRHFRQHANGSLWTWMSRASISIAAPTVACSRTRSATGPRFERPPRSASRRPKSSIPARGRRSLQQPAHPTGRNPDIGVVQTRRRQSDAAQQLHRRAAHPRRATKRVEVAQSSVAKYMVEDEATLPAMADLLSNHAPEIAAMDFFVVPTIGFELLYAFVIVRIDRRVLVWINVTKHPTAEWVARQITEAFP